MKLTCNTSGLLAACQVASAALPSKDLKPILKNFKVVADDDRATVIATDYEVAIRIDVLGLTIDEPGEAILPAARLTSILREVKDTALTIEATHNECLVRGDRLEFEMPSEDPSLYPDVPVFGDDGYHEIIAGDLREMIRRTIFATADDATRFAMAGLLWEFEGESIRLVATDGRRLATMARPATASGTHAVKGQQSVVPEKAMKLLESNLADPEQLVKVSFRANEVLFRTGNATIYSRLVEGRFPDYRQVIPKKTTASIQIQPKALLSAVRQAAVMADSETSKRITFEFGPGRLTIQAKVASLGRSKIEMALDSRNAPESISFNADYIAEFLKAIPDEPITLELTNGSSPALFRANDYLHLIMPLT